MQFALCYVSSTVSTVSASEIKEILEISSRNNNNNNITGILLYSSGNFFQVLEGEKEVIMNLFEKIRNDERHYDVISVFRKEIKQPHFRKYESDFLSLHSAYQQNDIELYTSQIDKLDPSIQSSVRYILQNFSQ